MSVAILGLAAYPCNRVWSKVEMLVRSARRNSPRTHVALLTAPLGDADRRQFDRFDVEAIECVDNPPPTGTTAESRDTRLRWILELYGRRHALYRGIVTTRNYSHVLLTDTRDVIVTTGLEDGTSVSLLVLSQEAKAMSLAEEFWNRQWIMDGYGEEGLTAIGKNPILCAGTVFGPSDHIAEYLLAMSGEVQRVGVDTTRRIGDQPLHNHLAYTGRLPEYSVSSAEDGWMRSIGILRFADVDFDWDPAQQRSDSIAPCAIVHQYDRHLAHRAMRHAVARVAGLPLMHSWRLEAYRENGTDLGSRVLRKVAHSTGLLLGAMTRPKSN